MRSPLSEDANLDPHIPDYVTHLPVTGNSTEITLTFCLFFVFPSITSERGRKSVSFPVKAFIFSQRATPKNTARAKVYQILSKPASD